MAPSSGSSAEATAYLINHIILPPNLPQADDYVPVYEKHLIDTTLTALRDLKGSVTLDHVDAVMSGVSALENLRDARDKFGNISEIQLLSIFNKLVDGGLAGPVPLEFKSQNAGILIARCSDTITFESFELSPTNEAAMRFSGRLIRTFPALASKISLEDMQKPDLIQSLARTISKLSSQSAPGMQPQIKKNGKKLCEQRDTTKPYMVTDFLMNLIAAHGATTDSSRITKNTREEVLWKNCLDPWRRSPLWLLIRVSLQLVFTREATNMQSLDSLYKGFMVQLLSRLLDASKQYWHTLGSESLHVISAKLCRRLRKMELLGQLGCLDLNWISQVRANVLSSHAVMDKNWKALTSSNQSGDSLASLSSIRPAKDLDTCLPELDAFILQIRARQKDHMLSIFSPTSTYPIFDASELPRILNDSSEYKLFGLVAIESWVEQHLQTWLASHRRDMDICEKLCKLITDYHGRANTRYRNDPVSMSIMYLTLLELWVACDKSACSIHPLLQTYNHELDLTACQCLLLPLKTQMSRLYEIERYIGSRTTAAALNAPSVYRDFGHPESFAVKFFEQSPELRSVMLQVECNAERKKLEKCQELSRLKHEYNSLMERHCNSVCETHEVVTDVDLGYTEVQHKPKCTRCALEDAAEKLDIKIYEWPLSSDRSVAEATIFEIRTPQAFSDWQNASVYMIHDVLSSLYTATTKPRHESMLEHHHELSHMLPHKHYARSIVPLSEIKSHTTTHRKRQKAIPHLENEDVCLENALQYYYYDKSRGVFCAEVQSTEAIAQKCLHEMPRRSEDLKRFIYKPHSAPDGVAPNEVLASLAECPYHLSIDEFKAFGAVPLGQNVIYSNILAQLAIPVVDFAKAETQTMVAQIVFQAGLPLDGRVERVSHNILTNASFGQAMLDQLGVALGRVSENWESWRAMATFILLARRTLSLASTAEIQARSLKFLADARHICLTWLLRLKLRVSSSTNDDQRTELCSRAAEVALVCTSTFDVERGFIGHILRQTSAISTLIQSSIVVQENLESIKSDHEDLHTTQLRSYRSMMYRILPELRDHMLHDNDGMNEALRANWAAFQAGPGIRWQVLEFPQHQWLTTTSGTLPVHFNLLTAELLVNGAPLSRLPRNYMIHYMYSPLFNRSALEVVPADAAGMAFSAKSTYNGYNLDFGMSNGDMLVGATKGNTKLDLLPSRLFHGRLPHAFAAEFIHWYDDAINEVFFRPRDHPWTACEDGWHLKRSGLAWQLAKGNTTLVNTSSNSSRIIAGVFAAVEDQQHMHMIFNIKSEIVDIELPRLQLDFYLENQESRISSREYRGMTIDDDQNVGSLVGLASRLVLKNPHNVQAQRLLLIPAPRTYTAPSVKYVMTPGSHHVSVNIHKDGPTKVYAYSIDKILGRILDSGDLQSKLFLCLLHALTSHCLPDSLTGCTGTEAALTILQSAAVRSFEFLSKENVELLGQLATLSPLRRFYPPQLMSMQQVEWDKNLPSLSQHAGFRARAQAIIHQGQQMQLFYPTNALDISSWKCSNSHLELRDTIRTSAFRTCGFGAEQFTTDQDARYDSRDRQTYNDRGIRAYKAARLIVRDQAALSTTLPNLKNVLCKAVFNKGVVLGTKGRLDLARLQYDSKWLQEPSAFLREYWCTLDVHLPTITGNSNSYDIAVWLSAMAYAESADMTTIQTLAAFYKIQGFYMVQPPLASQFDLSLGEQVKTTEIRILAESASRSFTNSAEATLPKQSSETKNQHSRRIRVLFQSRLDQAIHAFTAAIESQWPCTDPVAPNTEVINKYLDVHQIMKSISSKFQAWFDNRQFLDYLNKLSAAIAQEDIVNISAPTYIVTGPADKRDQCDTARHFGTKALFNMSPDNITCSKLTAPAEPSLQFSHSSENKTSQMEARLEWLCQSLQACASSTCEKDYVHNLRASCESLENQEEDAQLPSASVSNIHAILRDYLDACIKYLAYLNSTLAQTVHNNGSLSDQVCLQTQHAPRISPTFWLSKLHQDCFFTLSENWKQVIIKFGLAITHLHRAQRLVDVSQKPVDLAEEIRHIGHSNWHPEDFPELLLLEAESGITIRKEQEYIASQMRSPEHGRNVVLQLLMGGGKSSTIVPMLAVNFTNRKDLLRVIVAKPQSKQMQHMLIAKLGGMLNRRIYYMPFSRNLRFTEKDAITLRRIYEDCIENRGVLLIQPEHILSFKLMGIESLLMGQSSAAAHLLDTQLFFDRVSRDVVDESDMNFSVKFELIYTMGSQQSIEFAPERWLIIEDVLGILPRFAEQVKKVHPLSIEIEYSDGDVRKFPRLRLLRTDAVDHFLLLLAEHIVGYGVTGLPIRSQDPSMQAAVLRYITEPELTDEEIQSVENSSFWTETTQAPLLLIRGLIACGILRFALSTKRWRVNFGLDPSRTPKTSLAVPYRSKDAPSPRSEFSHPDVVIVLSLLSYYYGGLSDEEMFDAFGHLLKSDQASIHYDEWVSTAASSLPAAFHHLSGVSIRDRHQCIVEVFPNLRYSKKAIDYYLAFLVFPKEMKQFPEKLSGSGWDIGAIKTHPTTGFSGTNDTLHLLPLSVHHLDLPSQTHTNALVLGYLLKDETSVKLLPPRTTGSDAEHLLAFIGSLNDEVRVMLDCGAAILEQNNLQVAQTWLEISSIPGIEAVVFFSDEELSVLDHTGRIESLQTSPFAKQLDRCLVYLDESHSRGTDLKLPRTYRAAVTLGSHLCKDTLTQACMRMRLLGKGQAITFIVPEEISTKIRERTKKHLSDPIQVPDVLLWSIGETWDDLKRSMPLWAVQGHRFETHNHLLQGANTTLQQAKNFLEGEAQSLDDRYRPLMQGKGGVGLLQDWDMANENIGKIVQRCKDFGAMGFGSAVLSEEQERELAPEIEEERQIERPPRMNARPHALHPDLEQLVRTGKFPRSTTAFEQAFSTLVSTSAGKLFNLPSFPSSLLCTVDYARTVKIPAGTSNTNFVSDSYQRPVQWIMSVCGENTNDIQWLIILSPFEANKLVDQVKKYDKVTIHLFAPRANASFASLDKLELYNVGRSFHWRSVSRSLTALLNLFTGSLYLRSFDEYRELCDFLGLLQSKAKQGQRVSPDGFITPPKGVWGLKRSPVPFLRTLLMKIRREGEGVQKTHLGKILTGVRLEEADFGMDA